MRLHDDDALAAAVTKALHAGAADALEGLLEAHPGLATARIVSGGGRAGERTLLHVFADWPGCRPNPSTVVALLVARGARIDAAFVGAHAETALHWAASNNDVALLDVLLDVGADIDAPGSVIGGGSPLHDATAFGQWKAARRLIERGARPTLFDAAALGLDQHVEAMLATHDVDMITQALWGACHGGQSTTAELLLTHGADPSWVGWNDLTPTGAARRAGAGALADRMLAAESA